MHYEESDLATNRTQPVSWLVPMLLLLLLATAIATAAAGGGPIFSDGFESGDTLAWSQTVGLAGCPSGTAVSGVFSGDLGPAPAGPYTSIGCVEFRNDQGFPRGSETAWGGIPIREDLGLTSVDELLLVGPGERRLASQFQVLSRWGGRVDDLSRPIRWLQVAVRPTLLGDDAVTYALRLYPGLPAPVDPYAVTVQTQSNLTTISTGVATFVVDSTSPSLFDSIAVDLDDDGTGPQTTISTGGGGPHLVLGGVVLNTANGNVMIDPASFRIAESGPVRAVVTVSGHFVDVGGLTRCIDPNPDPPIDYDYEAMGFTAVATLDRASRDISLEFEVRNECSGAAGGDWTDESATLDLAGWDLPFDFAPDGSYWAGTGGVSASPAAFSGVTLVEQRKGGGVPWARRARASLDGVEQESAESLDRPLVA
ncbi:MAG: hypothetical protein K8J08_16830, partial [Thermoanaerobaculia bacterium]|nr:hypothetical protein [Thermoanaerobaculia bacterium]